MIQSIHKGRGFRGLLEYVLDPAKRPELVTSNMYGGDARSLAAELAELRALRPGLGKAVFHSSLSLPHGEAGREALSTDAWRDVAERYLAHLGFERSPFVVVRHRDTAHDHIHIVASRIDAHGRVVSDQHDYRRGEEVLRRLERDLGLTPVMPSRQADRAAMRSVEVARLDRTGEVSVRLRLQDLLDRATADRPTMTELVRRLEAAGVEVAPRIARTGHVSGISFRLEGVSFRGSALGRAYSFRGLEERLRVSYEPSRDLPALRAAADRALGPQRLGESRWSRSSLERLQRELGALRPRGQLRAEIARSLLVREGASAPVKAARLLLAFRSRQSALRHLARRAPGLGALSLALDTAVALRSPLGVVLFGTRLAAGATRKALAAGLERARPDAHRIVAAYLRAASSDQPARQLFLDRLKEAGVEPVLWRDGRGRPRGMAYQLAGEIVGGNEVGRAFTLEGLEKLGGDHDPARNPRGRPRGQQVGDGRDERERGFGRNSGAGGATNGGGDGEPRREARRHRPPGLNAPPHRDHRLGVDRGSDRDPDRDRGATELASRPKTGHSTSTRRAADVAHRASLAGGPPSDPERALERLTGASSREQELRARALHAALRRTGTPALADFRAASGHRDHRRIDAAWARRALRAGVSPHLVLHEVAHRGALAQAPVSARFRHATQTLARSLAAVRPTRPLPEIIHTLVQALAVVAKLPLAVVRALLIVRSVARELSQERSR